jgi:hypothetical protein
MTDTTDRDARLKKFCVSQAKTTADLVRQIQETTKYPVKYQAIYRWLRSTSVERPKRLPQYLHFIVEMWAKNNGFKA